MTATRRGPRRISDMDFELQRPDHIQEEPWAAIQQHRLRLELAWHSSDRPAVVGAAKELIECVAGAVLVATEQTIGDRADYSDRVNAAHKALARQAGQDVSQSPEIRSITQSARTIATQVSAVRNAVGTGHGRAYTPHIDEEMLTVVTDGALLWTRWALRRLGHLLAGYPNLLITEVNGSTNRDKLRRHFDAVVLPDQPPEIQQAVGVAFGQQAAGGFGLAVEVGIDPALADDATRYPNHYRLGVGEGMLLTRHGQIGLTDFYVPRFVGMLSPVPSALLVPWLEQMTGKVAQATWITRVRFASVDPLASLSALQAEQEGFAPEVQASMDRLRAALAFALVERDDDGE
jgi:hypothetical protein